MGFTFCSSSTEISFSILESICHNKNVKSAFPKSSSRLADLNRKERHSRVAKKAFISCHLVPGQLEGSHVRKKKVHEPSLKLEFIRTLLVDNYDSYTYNIYQELSVINGLPPVVIRNDEWPWEEIFYYLYEEKAFDNIVISPGPGSPTCPADIGICLRLLLECTDIPILGICLGHQALGYVHGAQVIHAPEPVHGRLSDIEHNGCGLFHGISSGRNSGFKTRFVVRYHSLVIDPSSLPGELIAIAWTPSSKTIPFFGTENFGSYYGGSERQVGSHTFANSLSSKSENGLQWHCSKSWEMKNGSILMGVMHSSRPHYFHPESIATCHGRQIFKNFAEITKDYWVGLRSSSDSKRKVPYSVVPNLTKLFQDAVTSRHLVNGFDNKKHASPCNLMNPSHSRNAKYLKLKWRKVQCSVNQVGGAENLFYMLFGDHHAGNTFWLDSSSTEMGSCYANYQELILDQVGHDSKTVDTAITSDRARFSFMGGKGGSLWRQLTFRLLSKSDMASNHGGHLSIEDADGNITSAYLEDGLFDFLNKELQSFRYDAADYEGLPFDFYGGYIGYMGYIQPPLCII
ncbi:hypothetical protein OROMI_010373 [Orobanche minor]